MDVSKDLIICFKDNKIFAFHARDQKTYIIEPEYLHYIASIAEKKFTEASSLPLRTSPKVDIPKYSNHKFKSDDYIIRELLSSNIIFDSGQIEDDNWQGDLPSRITHNASRILSSYNNDSLTVEQASQEFLAMSSNVEILPERYIPPSKAIISLPEPNLDVLKNRTLYETLMARKTCRNFIKSQLSLDQMSTLLFATLGPMHGTEWSEFDALNINRDLHQFRRTSPSATGLRGCDGYLLANNVAGLEAGAYYYNPESHALHKTQGTYQLDQIPFLMQDQFWSANIAAGIFIVTDLRYNWIKDDSTRGYLATYLDAGHLSQTILLTATAMGFSTWLSGTFRDEVVNQLLDINPDTMFASFFVGFGHGDNKALPNNFLKYL